MDTKRCPRCQKLQRADAQACSRCGYLFDKSARRSRVSRKPSLPPASPHRAGHYAGLHPEDHPYHSSLMEAQHPTVMRHEVIDEVNDEQWAVEDEDTSIGEVNAPQVPTRRASLRTQTARATIAHEQVEELPTRGDAPEETERAPVVSAPIERRETEPISEPPFSLPRPKLPRLRTWSLVLLLLTLFFLVISSVLAFLLIGNRPSIARASVVASPNQLRVNDTFLLRGNGFGVRDKLSLTYDGSRSIQTDNGKPLVASTNSQGSFSLEIRVTRQWSIGTHDIHVTDERMRLSVSTSITIQPTPEGPPLLQLSTTKLDFGSAASGTISERDLTLINHGGSSLNWQASSDQPWLSASPASGSFSGRATIQVKVNCGALVPRTYTGHLLFRATNGGATQAPITLTVTLSVEKPVSSALVVSTASLAFSTGAGLNPVAQTLVLQNTGDQPLNWTGAALTGDGSLWLELSPAEGQLPAHHSAIITISIQAAQLAVGTYQGTLNFHNAENETQVSVSLNVIAAGNLVASPPALSFTMTEGKQPEDKTLTLQNTGALALDWQASVATADQGNWLSTLDRSGSLDAGQQSTLTVHIDGNKLSPGSYQGTLTLSYGNQQKQVAVSLTVSPPPAPAILLAPSSLTFSTTKGGGFSAQLIALTNVGNAPLNWRISYSGAPISISPSQGTLAPGDSQVISVIPTSATATPGVSSATVTFTHSDSSQKVSPRQLNITIEVG